MNESTLIDTLQFGPDDAPTHKYEIYGEDEKTPKFAVISQRENDGSWKTLDEKISFAAEDEQQAASSTMDYGYSDGAPELRDLPAEARERCQQHWEKNSKA